MSPHSTSRFIRNAWYPVAWSHQLPTGALLSLDVIGEPLLLLRPEGRAPAAVSNLCPHRGAPLALGQATADGVRCGYHGLSFDSSGRCTDNPHGDRRVPPALALRTYPLVERHTLLWAWMGEAPADEAALPDFSLMDERDDGLFRGRDSIVMQSNYLLLADNLLDLSHANYLHEGLLGWPAHSNAEVGVRQEGASVVVTRSMQAVPVPRMHDLLFRNDGAPVDMWNEIRWQLPSCLTLLHGVGAARTRDPAYEFTAVHLLTPADEDRTHYLFGIVRPRATQERPELDAQVAEARRHAFENQDRVMLEAQHALLRRSPGFKPTMLGLDAASVRMRRIVEQRMAAERPAPAA